MDDRVMQFRVGAMVVATLIITAILVLVFGEAPKAGLRPGYDITIRFRKAPGVGPDTPVRRSGVLIGRVTEVTLEENGDVLVKASIEPGRHIYADDVCHITSNLLGDVNLEIVPRTSAEPVPWTRGANNDANDPRSGPFRPASMQVDRAGVPARRPRTPVPPGSAIEIEGQMAVDPVQVISDFQRNLGEVVKSIGTNTERLGVASERLTNLIDKNDAVLTRALERADSSFAALENAMKNADSAIDGVFGDAQQRAKLREAIGDLPELMRETKSAIAGMQKTMNLANDNLTNLDKVTRPLGMYGESIASRINSTAENLDVLTGELGRFSRELNSGRGTLGMLLNDTELYNNLNKAALRVEDLSRQLRPILDDARVFTDKIARHPESLGVRGALDRRPGIK